MPKFGLIVGVTLLWLCGCSTPQPVPVLTKDAAISRAQVDIGAGRTDGAVRLQLPANTTGTGPHDFYNLFAQYHQGKTVLYGLSIATSSQHSNQGTAVLVNGVGALDELTPAEVPLLLSRKANYLEVTFSRDFVERSTVTGRYFTLRGSLGTYEFPVPDWMFSALLEGLDQRLPDLRKKSFNVPEVMYRPTLRQRYVNLHPDLPYPIRAAILAGEVAKTMTTDAVRASWGEPEIILQGRDEKGAFEVWRYPSTRLVIEHGELTGWKVD
jgi:hypothetical protein